MLCRGITVEVRYDTCPLEEAMLCYVGDITVDVRYDTCPLEETMLCYVGVFFYYLIKHAPLRLRNTAC